MNIRDVKIFPGGFFDDSSSVASTPAPAGRSKAAAGVSPDSARGDPERGDEQPIGAQIQSIPQPRFVGSLLTVELPSLVGEFHSKNFMVEQPKNNVSDLQFEKTPSHRLLSLVGRRTSKLKCALDSRSRNGKFSRRSKDIAVDFWATVSELRNARCEDRISADEDHPEVEYQEESPKAESSKRRPIPSWPLYDYFRVTSTLETILDFSDLTYFTLRGPRI